MFQFNSNYKKFGYKVISKDNVDELSEIDFRPYIKILFVPQGYKLVVDFNLYETVSPTLFFVNSNQYFNVIEAGEENGQMVFYNRDFYCVQIHDAEVACDGLLFNNIFQMPKTDLSEFEKEKVKNVFDNILDELKLADTHSEEIIRIRIKEVIIRATRLWKAQNLSIENPKNADMETELFRDFGRLVEIHFREKHAVADYAELMGLAPKTLANKFHKMKMENPNEFIKNRILLEAKRLLTYTDLSVKEIAYQLGYDDPAYFNRLFTQKTKDSPAAFRKSFV